MGWFSWLRRKPRTPRLVIDIFDDHFEVNTHWPRADKLSDEQASLMAKNLITVSYLLTQTPLGINRVIMAISNAAERTGDDDFGQYVVSKLVEMVKPDTSSKVEKSGPLVSPTSAFGLRRTSKRGAID